MIKIIGSKTFDVPIAVLYQQRGIYDNYPSFQRGTVWPSPRKKFLIDSIIRGYPIGEILSYQDEEGLHQVIDGKQRLSAIFSFLDGDYTTISQVGLKDLEPQQLDAIEPKRYYHQLTVAAQRQIQNYTLHFMTVDQRNEKELGAIFRRLQLNIDLTQGEKYFSYASRAKDIAEELTHHAFFNSVYTGTKKNKTPFQMILYILELERDGFPKDLKQKALSRLTSGLYDTELNETIVEALDRKLTLMISLFCNAKVVAKTDIIAMYQAVTILEEQDFDLENSDVGCLTPWIHLAKHYNLGSTSWGNLNTLAQSGNANIQKKIWESTLREKLFQSPGLQRKNKQFS